MPIRKLIVTNLAALRKKYGASGVAQIKKALERLEATDKVRGIATMFEAITGNARQVKQTIDNLFIKHKSPDYLLILGGPDIVPHQVLKNPMRIPDGDEDPNVPSDLPYASSVPFSTDIAKFIGPTRVVGRLPDVRGSKDVQQLVSLIDAATTFSGTPGKQSFAISADEWRGASLKNIKLAFGAKPKRTVAMVPPSSPPWDAAKLAAPLHFINCHGGDTDSNFFGSSPRFPVAHQQQDLIGNVTRGTVVSAECCYGAQLYKPTAKTPLGIANTYLLQGAIGYCGSTNVAYGGEKADERCDADILCVDFVKSVLSGASIGRAFLEARQQFVESLDGPLDPADLKTLGQFLLLGDPSARPFGAGVKKPKTAVSRALGVPKAKELSRARQQVRHQLRRTELSKAGKEISRTQPFACRKASPAKDAGAARALAVVESAGELPGPTITYSVERPAGASPKKKAKGVRSLASPREEIQVTFSRAAPPPLVETPFARGLVPEAAPPGVVKIKAVVTRIRDGQVVSFKPIVSR